MRLTVIDDNQIHYHIWFDRWDAYQPERARWMYEVYAEPIGRTLAIGTDLTTVCFDGIPNYAEAMSALFGFLGAAIESFPDGENANLFQNIDVLAEVCDTDELSTMSAMMGDEQ